MKCYSNVILSEDEKIEVGDHVLIFDKDKLLIIKMTDSTFIESVIGKIEKAYRLF